MAYSKYLVQNRHKTTYYFRIQIPVHLRPLFNNRKYLKKTTDTSDRDVALHAAMQLKCYTYNLFTALDGNMIKRKRKSSSKPKELITGLITTAFGDIDFGGDKCEKAAKQELEAANETYDRMAANPELAIEILKTKSSLPL